MIRNAAETEVPMIPPILLKEPNLELIAEAVAATAIEVMTTMLGTMRLSDFLSLESGSTRSHEGRKKHSYAAYVEWPKEKKVPTVTGRCPDATSRRVIKSIACSKVQP